MVELYLGSSDNTVKVWDLKMGFNLVHVCIKKGIMLAGTPKRQHCFGVLG